MSSLLSLPRATPAWETAHMMAHQLAGKIEAGNFRRLPDCEKVELRNLAMALAKFSDELRAAEPVVDRLPKPRVWWRFGR
jgi:hypothetical protein